MPSTEPSYTCPHCGAVSYNSNDLHHSYCNRCKRFAGDDFFRPGSVYAVPPIDMRGKLRIVSDGTSQGTKVFDSDGRPVANGRTAITSIEIDPIVPNRPISARIHVRDIELNLAVLELGAQVVRLSFPRPGSDDPDDSPPAAA